VTPAAAGPEARLARLQEAGIVRRGEGKRVAKLAATDETPLPSGSGLLDALLEERGDGR
jgi:hypothetical protein